MPYLHTQGLSIQEAKQLLQTYGLNKLTEAKKTPLIFKFFAQFKDMLVLILIFAAAFSFFVGEGIDGLVITAIILINALIGFLQEYKADRTLEALKHMVTTTAVVIRDGQEQQINVTELVPGDLIKLTEGDRIPADGVVLVSNELKVEESALTGEAIPVEKTATDNTESRAEAERISMGTTVVYGSGQALITATGMNTTFGRIAKLTSETQDEISPLQKEMMSIGRFVGKATLLITLLLLGVIFLRGFTLLDGVIYAISIAVAAVPEGLPATVSIALALGVERMAKKKAIVKKLASVETLGATTVICSDKTGTLTANMMTVVEAYIAGHAVFTFSGTGYDHQQGALEYTEELPEALVHTLRIGALCNDAALHHTEGRFELIGDPTEGALLTAYNKTAKDHHTLPALATLQQEQERSKVFPFDSQRKRMSVLTGSILLTKGAPDLLLQQCTSIHTPEGVRAITEEDRADILKHIATMSAKALRTLAFAYRELENPNSSKEEAETNLIFAGVVGMIDPPRPEVPAAVAACKQAGIRIIMITGDYADTAKAIGEQTGILSGKQQRIITGEEFESMPAAERITVLTTPQDLIFARVAPHHKMEIVELLQKQGEIVAVTGDGVNDAPALKKSNIGIAMGISGTDVSKEAADMVLTDDSFATIQVAIEEGRTIYANLVKFVWFIFSCNIGEIFLIAFALVSGLPLPLTALMILLVNLGTDVLPALALGVDPTDPTHMQKNPRNPKHRIMERPFYSHFIGMGAVMGGLVFVLYLWELYALGYFADPAGFTEYQHRYAMSVAFASLVVIQMANAINAKERGRSIFQRDTWNNPLLFGAIAISLGVVCLCVYVPVLQHLFELEAIHATDWLWMLLMAVVMIGVEELRKKLGTSN